MQEFQDLVQELSTKVKILESKLASKQSEILQLKNLLKIKEEEMFEFSQQIHIEKRELQFLIFKVNSLLEQKCITHFKISCENLQQKSNLEIIRLIHQALMSLRII